MLYAKEKLALASANITPALNNRQIAIREMTPELWSNIHVNSLPQQEHTKGKAGGHQTQMVKNVFLCEECLFPDQCKGHHSVERNEVIRQELVRSSLKEKSLQFRRYVDWVNNHENTSKASTSRNN